MPVLDEPLAAGPLDGGVEKAVADQNVRPDAGLGVGRRAGARVSSVD